jgi:hypothetical protein
MTFTPISDGTTNWGFVLNAALNDLQSQVTAAQATANTGNWQPEDNGQIAWTMDPYVSSSSRSVTSGTVSLFLVSIKKAATITNIVISRSVAFTNGNAGQNFAGIYDISGTRLGQTADQTTNWSAATAPQEVALTAQLPVVAGKYWIALLANWTGGTAPTFLGGPAGVGAAYNIGTTSSTRRVATFGSGLTALPSSITPSSMTGVVGNPLALGLT